MKNSILNKFFKNFEEYFEFWIFRQAFVEQMLDVPQQIRKAFLLGKNSDFTSARAPDISNQYAVVIRTTAFINMRESDFWDSENPELVALPTVNDFFAKLTPVIIMDKFHRGQLALLKTFLYVPGGMITWQNIFIST